MSLCNVEIFEQDFSFKDVSQAINKKYSIDYISMEKNAIEVMKIAAKKDDYIRITQEGREHCGIIDEVNKKKNAYEIKYRPIMSIFDLNVHFNKEDLERMPLEEWLKSIMEDLYKNNEDRMQNKQGFEVIINSSTHPAILELEKNITNFYKDILTKIIISHGIIITEKMDFMKKKLSILIGKEEGGLKHIEADFPNVISAEVVSKKTKEFINKVTIFNEKNETEKESYYLMENGTVTKEAGGSGRILPVVPDVAYISFEAKDDKTFTEAAYEKAFSMLNKGKYDNLIEIEVYYTDMLVEPMNIQIGQEVEIRLSGGVYRTILTGREEKEKTVVLIFGAIRLELTKILKERIK